MASIGSFSVVNNQITTAAIANEAIAIANTEQSYTMPTGTKLFLLYNRGSGLIKYTYTATESGTKYRSLYPHNSILIENIASAPTLYFQGENVGDILEVESWS